MNSKQSYYLLLSGGILFILVSFVLTTVAINAKYPWYLHEYTQDGQDYVVSFGMYAWSIGYDDLKYYDEIQYGCFYSENTCVISMGIAFEIDGYNADRSMAKIHDIIVAATMISILYVFAEVWCIVYYGKHYIVARYIIVLLTAMYWLALILVPLDFQFYTRLTFPPKGQFPASFQIFVYSCTSMTAAMVCLLMSIIWYRPNDHKKKGLLLEDDLENSRINNE